MPGVDPAAFAGDETQLLSDLATTLASAPRAAAEPALDCYARGGGCPGVRLGALRLRATPRRVRHARRVVVTIRATVVRGDGRRLAAAGAIAWVGHRALTLGADGTARVALARARRGAHRIYAVAPAVGVGATTIDVR
jgi:hypothetical protein